MQICIVFTQLCYILMQKEWNFQHLKMIIKHAEFVSEWRKSRFCLDFPPRGAEGGGGGWGEGGHRTPSAKNMDAPLKSLFKMHSW